MNGPLSAGDVGPITVPFPCQIIEWQLLGDVIGDLEVDIRKESFADYSQGNPSDPGDSITGLTLPTLVAQIAALSTTLTDWSPSIAAGEILRIYILSANGIQAATLTLKVLRT